MRELIPVVFNKASQEQKRAIIAYAEMELTKKIESESIPKVRTCALSRIMFVDFATFCFMYFVRT